jgi:hypothetical protein
MKRETYKRHYINVSLRKNTTQTPKAPQFIRHLIVSPVLAAHFKHCVMNDLPMTFDVSAFLDYDDNSAVITISVPYALSRTNKLTNFFEPEVTSDE